MEEFRADGQAQSHGAGHLQLTETGLTSRRRRGDGDSAPRRHRKKRRRSKGKNRREYNGQGSEITKLCADNILGVPPDKDASDLPLTNELTEEQLKIFAENCWLVDLVENGVSIREALRRLGISRTERSVRELVQRYRSEGRRALFDRRWFRRPESDVLTTQVKKLILGLYFAWPAAGPRAIWRELCKQCRERGLPEPSESTVFKFLGSLPEAFKMFREGKAGIRKWEQTAAPVVRYENTHFANERWQGDHSPLSIWVRAKVDGQWQAFRAYMSVVLDAHSRSIPGVVISIKYPDQWSIALLFYRAIMPKKRKTWLNRGRPFVFQSDRGKDFLSHAMVATLTKMKVILDPDPAYYPNRKGKVERFFLTLDSGCLRLLPGHMDAVGTTEGAAAKRVREFLTVPQLTAEIERWIDEDYHRRTHSETGRKPADLWEETARVLMPDEDELCRQLLKSDIVRSVRNTGVPFTFDGIEHVYWSPELLYHFRREVRVSYNPEDLESVLLYCAATGAFICEAFDMYAPEPRYTARDVLRCKSEFRRGMKERIKDYMEEIYLQDRRVARPDEWEEARERALEAQEARLSEGAADDEDDGNDEDIASLIEKFRMLDRGQNS